MSTAEEIQKRAAAIQKEWDTNPRWKGVVRPYSAQRVAELQGSIVEEHTLAERGAKRLWKMLHEEDYINALGAITGNQAVQMVRAGLKAIYLSGWQVAADGNTSDNTYPDQSLYPYDSAPKMVRRINNAFKRADEITWSEHQDVDFDWFAPIIADAEAGFGLSLIHI